MCQRTGERHVGLRLAIKEDVQAVVMDEHRPLTRKTTMRKIFDAQIPLRGSVVKGIALRCLPR